MVMNNAVAEPRTNPETILHFTNQADLLERQQQHIQEISRLWRRVGFLEGLVHGLRHLDSEEVPEALENGIERYESMTEKWD